ncbi:hypothetical protein Tco_0054165 [Tanacetum coccineum]
MWDDPRTKDFRSKGMKQKRSNSSIKLKLICNIKGFGDKFLINFLQILPLVSTVKDSADTNVISSLAGYPPSNKKLPKPKTATNKLNKNLEKSPSEYSQDQEGKSRESKEATDEDNDDDRPSTRLNQGKKTKEERLKESASANEPVQEPIAEVVMDGDGDDVARDVNQPQDTLEPKTRKTLNP